MNVEPGWRRALVTKLNWLLLLPGVTAVIALIAPVRGSIETSADAGSVGSVSTCVIAAVAALLQARVDRRVDPQPALAHGVRAVLLLQQLLDVAEEVRLADADEALARASARGRLSPSRAAYSDDVMSPFTSIARSTSFRRASAAAGLRNGS